MRDPGKVGVFGRKKFQNWQELGDIACQKYFCLKYFLFDLHFYFR